MKKFLWAVLFLLVGGTLVFSTPVEATENEFSTLNIPVSTTGLEYKEITSLDSYIENGNTIFNMSDGSEVTLHELEIPEDAVEITLFEEVSVSLFAAVWTSTTIPKNVYASTTILSSTYSPPQNSVTMTRGVKGLLDIGNYRYSVTANYKGNIPWTGRSQAGTSSFQYYHQYGGNIPYTGYTNHGAV